MTTVMTDRQEQMKLVVAGVVLVSLQMFGKPLWRVASAIVGRLYLNLVVVGKSGNKDDDKDEENDLKVSGLYIHPGKFCWMFLNHEE